MIASGANSFLPGCVSLVEAQPKFFFSITRRFLGQTTGRGAAHAGNNMGLILDDLNILTQARLERLAPVTQPFYYPISATLTTANQATAPSTGLPVTISNFWFLVTGVYADAIDATGARLSNALTFDQITVSITDRDGKNEITNGAVDVLTFNNQGFDQSWAGWLFRPLRNFNIYFQWNPVGGGGGVSTAPIIASLYLRGYDLGYRGANVAPGTITP